MKTLQLHYPMIQFITLINNGYLFERLTRLESKLEVEISRRGVTESRKPKSTCVLAQTLSLFFSEDPPENYLMVTGGLLLKHYVLLLFYFYYLMLSLVNVYPPSSSSRARLENASFSELYKIEEASEELGSLIHTCRKG